MVRLLSVVLISALSVYGLSGCAPKDCEGVRGGSATLDACGVCNGEGPLNNDKSLCGFVQIKAGAFTMGSPESEIDRSDDESEHRVTLTKDFYLGKNEVTQSEYKALMEKSPSLFKQCGSDCPVTDVNWYDAVAYANALSDEHGLSRCYSGSGESIRWDRACKGYRLPTEAEWEYAARANTTTMTYAGDMSLPNRGELSTEEWIKLTTTFSSPVLDAIAWYGSNSAVTYKGADKGRGTHPVGQKKPNAWGLYGMLGNVQEWTWDRYDLYSSDFNDPTGPNSGSQRVKRGGSWWSSAAGSRAAVRHKESPKASFHYIGFRLARTVQ